jgi:hypothetical protein
MSGSNGGRGAPVQREVLVGGGRWCESPVCRLFGLQLRRVWDRGGSAAGPPARYPRPPFTCSCLLPDCGCVINAGTVTSAQLARPWRPYYVSSEPARYVRRPAPNCCSGLGRATRLSSAP